MERHNIIVKGEMFPVGLVLKKREIPSKEWKVTLRWFTDINMLKFCLYCIFHHILNSEKRHKEKQIQPSELFFILVFQHDLLYTAASLPLYYCLCNSTKGCNSQDCRAEEDICSFSNYDCVLHKAFDIVFTVINGFLIRK